MSEATYRVGVTGRSGLGGTVRHALPPEDATMRSLCGVYCMHEALGTWSPNHPRSCQRCKREASRRG